MLTEDFVSSTLLASPFTTPDIHEHLPVRFRHLSSHQESVPCLSGLHTRKVHSPLKLLSEPESVFPAHFFPCISFPSPLHPMLYGMLQQVSLLFFSCLLNHHFVVTVFLHRCWLFTFIFGKFLNIHHLMRLCDKNFHRSCCSFFPRILCIYTYFNLILLLLSYL